MKQFCKIFLFSVGFLLMFGVCHLAWQFQRANAQNKPLSYPEIFTALGSKIPSKSFKNKTELINFLIAQIKSRGVDKPLTKDREDDLRQAGATDEIIEAIRQSFISTATATATPAPTPTPTPTIVDNPKTFKNSIGMEFVYIPNGSFEMGSPDEYPIPDGYPDEKPAHRVTISKGFYMGKYEVTQTEYEKVMGVKPSDFKNFLRCPVENVSWDDAQDFIKTLNAKNEGTYRLPTEAEWEYAARAGTKTKWSFGDDKSALANYAWYEANSGNQTHDVGTLKPNDFGLYDMHGNVWEWCQDWYATYYYTKNPATDPTGPTGGLERVRRGGSYSANDGLWRSADRQSSMPSLRKPNIGFRVVKQ